ncbi:MAG: hypothetical protein GC166_03555 [Alphaproteobacteria bacterium]|nr:hypothetical protein [Alphaproteobacteria bacterium]
MIRRIAVLLLAAGLAACASGPREEGPQAIETPPPGEPAEFYGIKAAALTGAMGKPQFVRKDGSFELWRYDSATCKAFFFLYKDSGALAVRHVETLPRGRSIAADLDCLSAMRGRNAVS